jgi:hypothetical protein
MKVLASCVRRSSTKPEKDFQTPRISSGSKTLERCADATQKRNDYVHGLWCHELDVGPKLRTSDGLFHDLPTLAELDGLHVQIDGLWKELNHARFEGYLRAALASR